MGKFTEAAEDVSPMDYLMSSIKNSHFKFQGLFEDDDDQGATLSVDTAP